MKKFDQKREEIKQAGIKSFAAYGYYKTTLDDIAAMLGMKKNSLYYYFESKEALFLEIIQDTIARHQQRENDILAQALPAADKLQKLIHTLIEFIQANTLKYTIKISSYTEICKVIYNSFPEFKEKQQKSLQTILEEGVLNKEFKPHNSKQLAGDIAQFIPAIFNHHYINSEAKFVSEIDFKPIAEEIKRLMKYIIDGIRVETD